MEMNSHDQSPEKRTTSCGLIMRSIRSTVAETMKKTKKIGEDDPRRIVHSMKVGLALTLVSLFYYFRPLYDGFGQAGMWAILTVVVVFEFSVGGTLSKSINRGCATLLAGALGVGAEYLASVCGDKGEPIILGLMVFFLAAISTFTRFIPNVKRRYDYGVLIFILTFSLVAVSGFRVNQILQLAHQRLSTILIGGATCMIISIFVCPVWAGQDLHFSVATNIEKLASFLEAFGDEIVTFGGEESDSSKGCSSKNDQKKSCLQGYKSVLNSKASEESLANFAWWEPPHGGFKFHHPWKQYLKIGALTRECACLIESLNGYINSKSQEKVRSEIQMKMEEACIEMSKESGKRLREVGTAVKKMRQPSSSENSKTAMEEVKKILETPSQPIKAHLQEIMPVLVIASVLIDIINCVDKISVSVHQLSRTASFKNPNSTDKQQQQQVLHRGIVNPLDDGGTPHDHVLVAGDSPEKKNHHSPE